MTTICIQIGNTDNKLTQQEWSEYCRAVRGICEPSADDAWFYESPNEYHVLEWRRAVSCPSCKVLIKPGECVAPDENMRELVKEYAETQRDGNDHN